MGNYSAVVVKIENLRPHNNADRLVCTNIFGHNIIVGKETQIGDIGLYFPLETQIGEEFCKVNDLLRRKDEQGKPAGGMFDANTRRVRCQKFRGEPSEGFFIPIESLGEQASKVKMGDELDEPLATKYIPRTNRVGGGTVTKGRKPRESKIIPNQFRFHFDTEQLGRNMHKINPEDLIVLTWKLHGTSAIVSNCLVKKPLNPLLKLLKALGVPVKDQHYEYIYASRRVIKNEFAEQKQHYYNEDLWSAVGKREFEGKLVQGEQIFYEILGFTEGGAPIQKDFDYRCDPAGILGPVNKVVIYRITRTAPDGTVTELQWNQVVARAKEMGVETVPTIFYGDTTAMWEGEGIADWQNMFLKYLQEKYVNGQDSEFCNNKVPEEGICVRKEGLNIEIFKLKSFRFLEYESKQLDSEIIDIETGQSF